MSKDALMMHDIDSPSCSALLPADMGIEYFKVIRIPSPKSISEAMRERIPRQQPSAKSMLDDVLPGEDIPYHMMLCSDVVHATRYSKMMAANSCTDLVDFSIAKVVGWRLASCGVISSPIMDRYVEGGAET
ncbi:predicted protein [Lichtheimia corymbifera JMRC:FSU:9682]|uniref:Uncharacterized protein n=1 Tax=Lichtheimia corymbifera JMRC:FSU:9682 TaxID=1263082 RepID=A0A068RTL4_9FUNG|nr:predicted protein [Lichtheimia corymbifera JMRC:FSU:9682]